MPVVKKNNLQSAFTIVEMIVVIAVIAILATITIVGYGAWRDSATSTQIKSDLNAAAAAMESARTFGTGYPTSLPTTVTPSSNVSLILQAGSNASAYCIDGSSSNNAALLFYVASENKDKKALEGTCATRPNQQIPSSPTSLVVVSSTVSSVELSWTASTNFPTSYTAQCASDAAFIVGLQQSTQPTTSTTVTGLNASATRYCRVNAVNEAGASTWSARVNGNSSGYSCSDNGQYGSYPDCFAYDALPIASSIEGYWTTAPAGYLFEDGSAVSRTTYADLFATLGTTYGAGNGTTTFNLPDSRGRTAVNLNPSDSEFDVIGERPGSKTEQLTIAQMPSHTHKLPWQDNGSDVSDYLGGSGAAYGIAMSYAGRTGEYDLLEPVGGGQGHNNIQPSIVKHFAIKYRPSTGTDSLLPAGTSIQGYWATAPSGYLLEDGSAISRSTYSDLFGVMSTTHGVGNGSTTFNLPDSRGRTAVNINTADSEFDVMGERPGSKSEQLTIAQIPSHTHKVPYLASGSDVSDYLGGSGAPYGMASSYALRTGTYSALEYVGGDQPHNNIQPSITKTFAVKYTPSAGSTEASPKGTSIEGYWATAPSGYLLENGSAISRSTYSGLFAVIGTTYGNGDGSTTFNIPDSRGRTGVNLNPTDSEFDVMGEKYGEKSVTLTIAQLPSHTHKLPWQQNGSDVSDYLGGSGASYGLSQSYTSKSGTYDMLEPVGGGGSHNNIQPSIVKSFAIKY